MKRSTQLRIALAIVDAFIIFVLVNMFVSNGWIGFGIGVVLGATTIALPERLLIRK